jgi:hypothetical protein
MSDESWKPIPGFPGYEASDLGNFRSLDRVTASGRRCKGQPLSTRVSNRGYLLVDLRTAEGKKVTRSVHTVILEAHDKPCPPGMEARHLDDNPLHNRWVPGATEDESRARGGNLWWGTPGQNRADRRRNTPTAAPPKPQKACVECKNPFEGNGRRCHPCVVTIGRSAASLLTQGKTLEAATKALNYPSAEGLHTLAVRYGGYGARKSWWSRSVKPKVVTLRKRVPRRRRSRTVSSSGRGVSRSGETPPEGRKSVAGFRPKPGLSGTSGTRSVTERDTTERGRVPPVPADLTQRKQPDRARGGPTRRSR